MIMMRRAALTISIAFVAALVGLLAGRAVIRTPEAPETELHRVLHREIKLDAGQQSRLHELNEDFYARKVELEARLKEDNAALAQAMAKEHAYGPRVAAAVDQSHHTMGALQKVTLEHVFAMRDILRPEQRARYDAAVAKALTTSEP